MFDILIPKNHFLALDYPDTEDYILGLPIPIGWGDIHNIVPFCVDTTDLRFKLVDQHIQDITEIRSKGIPLSSGSFTPDLAVGEFILKGTPYIVGGYTYYFAISSDYAISGTDHLNLFLMTHAAGNQAYEINGANLWTPNVGHQLWFYIYGKKTLDSPEEWIYNVPGVLINSVAFRDTAARTRIGEAFVAPAPGYYVTRIRVYFTPTTGTPAGSLMVTLFSGINPDVQQGIQGDAIPIVNGQPIYDLSLPQEGKDSDLEADIESPYPMITTGAEILQDLFVSILNKNPVPALLEPVSLANFAAKRPQELKVFIDREIAVGEFIGKLEASLLWKFLPLQDGTYAPIVFEPGIPIGTPHFRDIDFVEGAPFQIERELSVVRNIVRVKYDENPATQEFKVQEARSDFARLFYSNEETIEFETWLKQDADALDLAEDYSLMFQKPEIRVVFEVHGAGLALLPGRDKVILSRARAAWPGGAIVAQLFRIMKIVKSPATNSAKITATPEYSGYGPELYYCHFALNTIAGVRLDDFKTDKTYIPGGYGSGDGQFANARQVAHDGTYIYVADDLNDRVQKFRDSDGVFVAKTGAGVVARPWGCVYWNGKLYVSSETEDKIYILDAMTLGLISSFGSHGAAGGQFIGPRSMATDGTYLYICDTLNDRIQKFTLAGMPIGQVGSPGTGNGEFNGPTGIATDGIYFVVCDYGNQRIQKFLCSDLSFVSSVSVQTRGGAKGFPESITLNGIYFYVGCANAAPFRGYIEKYVIATDAFIDYYDPSPVVGIDVDHVWGSFILKEAD